MMTPTRAGAGGRNAHVANKWKAKCGQRAKAVRPSTCITALFTPLFSVARLLCCWVLRAGRIRERTATPVQADDAAERLRGLLSVALRRRHWSIGTQQRHPWRGRLGNHPAGYCTQFGRIHASFRFRVFGNARRSLRPAAELEERSEASQPVTRRPLLRSLES